MKKADWKVKSSEVNSQGRRRSNVDWVTEALELRAEDVCQIEAQRSSLNLTFRSLSLI